MLWLPECLAVADSTQVMSNHSIDILYSLSEVTKYKSFRAELSWDPCSDRHRILVSSQNEFKLENDELTVLKERRQQVQ